MPSSDSIIDFVITDHARLELTRRRIDETLVARVLKSPEQTELIRAGRKLFQSRMDLGRPSKPYLLRVFVDVDRQPPEVVTVYQTSKVKKYWRANESPL